MTPEREKQVAAIKAKPIQERTMDEIAIVLMYDKGMFGDGYISPNGPAPQGLAEERRSIAAMEKQRLG